MEENQGGGPSSPVEPIHNPIEGVSAKAEYNGNIHQDVGKEATSFLDQLPEQLRQERAFQNVKSVEDLANQYLNAQKLVGKKTIGLPDENASPEQIEDFYSKLRPESADKYEFKNDHFPEDFQRDEELASAVKEIFHEAGLSQRQAEMVQQKYEQLLSERFKEPTKEEQEVAFEKLGREVLGNDYESIIENATKVSSEIVPDSVKEMVAGFSDDQLIAFAAMIDNVQKKFMKEDNSGNRQAAPSGFDRRAEASRLMNHPAFNNGLHPEHDRIKQQWNALYR